MNRGDEALDVIAPLARAVAELATTTDRLSERLTSADGDFDAAERELACLDALVTDLRSHVASASERVVALVDEQRYAAAAGAATWPARRDRLAGALNRDPLGGAAAILQAWVAALSSGHFAEAERIATEPFEWPEAMTWIPARCAETMDALAERAPDRVSSLFRYLLLDDGSGGRPAMLPEDRPGLAALWIRLTAIGKGSGAHVVGLLDGTTLEHPRVLAARAMALRWAASPDDAPGDIERGRELVERVGEDGGGVAAVDESLRLAEAGQRPIDELLNEARRLAADMTAVLPEVEAALDALLCPPSAVLMAALADRALSEHRYALSERLLDRVGSVEETPVTAFVADLRTTLALRGGDEDTALETLLAAGDAYMLVPRYDEAIARFEQGLTLRPGNSDAALRLAEALLLTSWDKPLAEVRDLLERASGLIHDARQRDGVSPASSWSLVTEAALHTELARTASPERGTHLWSAAVAAGRALAFGPSDPGRWVALAQSLNVLLRLRAAEVATRPAIALAPAGNGSAQQQRLIALANLGRNDEALPLLTIEDAERPSPWNDAVRAFMYQRDGNLTPAVEAATRAVRDTPTDPWIHLVHAEALSLGGDEAEAAKEWTWLWREALLDEADGLISAARAAVELRLGADAVAIAQRAVEVERVTVSEGESRLLLGCALLLVGDTDGAADVSAGIRSSLTPRRLADIRRQLGVLAPNLPVDDSPPTFLHWVEQEIAETLSELRDRFDTRPDGESAALEIGLAANNPAYDERTRAVARLGADLAEAWCRLACGDGSGTAALRSLAAAHPEMPELADAADAAPSLMARLAPTDPVDPVTTPPRTEHPAESEPPDQARATGLSLVLPPSWFLQGPPEDHRLFRQDLPAARAWVKRRLGLVLPPVRVTVDAAIEPDGFTIQLGDQEIDHGRLSPGLWYCPAAWLPNLPEDLVKAAGSPDGELGLTALPPASSEDPLAAVIARPPTAVIAFRVAERWAGAPVT